MPRERATRTADQSNEERDGEQAAQRESDSTRYEVGPGFELAIRAALNHPIEVHVKGEEKSPGPTTPAEDSDHRRGTLEQRLDSVERALFLIVDHLKSIDDHISELRRRQTPP